MPDDEYTRFWRLEDSRSIIRASPFRSRLVLNGQFQRARFLLIQAKIADIINGRLGEFGSRFGTRNPQDLVSEIPVQTQPRKNTFEHGIQFLVGQLQCHGSSLANLPLEDRHTINADADLRLTRQFLQGHDQRRLLKIDRDFQIQRRT